MIEVVARAAFVLLVAGLSGTGLLACLTGVSRTGRRVLAEALVAIPLGLGCLAFVGYASLRIALFLGHGAPFRLSLLATGAAAAVLSGVGLVHSRRRTERAEGAVLVAAVLMLIAIMAVAVLPLAMSWDMRFFAGIGTDATGYVRAAQALREGWFLQPIPDITMDDVLHRGHRAWTYILMAIQDRPVTFHLIASVADLTRTDAFTAYLVVGAVSPAVLLSLALFLVLDGLPSGRSRWFVLTTTGGLAALAGLTGNLFHQFLGHVLSTVSAVALTPVVFGVISGPRSSSVPWRLGIAAFLVALVSIGLYDVRVAVLSLTAALGGWLWTLQVRDPRRVLLAAGMVATGLGLASLFGGAATRDWTALARPAPNLFPTIEFSFPRMLLEAGLLRSVESWVTPVILGCSAVIVLGQAAEFVRWRPECRSSMLAGFVTNYLFLLHGGTLVAAIALLALGNDWAAHKMLYFVLATQSVAGAGLLTVWARRGPGWREVALAVCVAVCAQEAVRATSARSAAVLRSPHDYGVITRQGLPRVVEGLRSTRPDLVWYEGTMLGWLVFISVVGDSPWITLAPQPVWLGGAGLFPSAWPVHGASVSPVPGERVEDYARRLYQDALGQGAVRDARTAVAVWEGERSDGPSGTTCRHGYCVADVPVRWVIERAEASLR